MSRSTISTFKLFELFPDEPSEEPERKPARLNLKKHKTWSHADGREISSALRQRFE